jgi:hypothetical protein
MGVLFKDFCWQEWKDKYSTSPPWGKKEFAQLAEARARLDTEDLARSAWASFMQSTDSFHEGHSPGQFLFSLSKMTARAVKAIPKKQLQGEAVSQAMEARRKIMMEVRADPKLTTELQRRDEYARRARELP